MINDHHVLSLQYDCCKWWSSDVITDRSILACPRQCLPERRPVFRHNGHLCNNFELATTREREVNEKLWREYEENMKICQDIAKFAKYDMLLGLIVGHSGHSFWAKFCLHLHVEFASYTQGNHSETSRGAVKVEGRPSVGPIRHPTYIHSMTNLKP